jgi:hypothetical protein
MTSSVLIATSPGPPQMGDDTSAATISPTGFGANDAHEFAIVFEFDLRLR